MHCNSCTESAGQKGGIFISTAQKKIKKEIKTEPVFYRRISSTKYKVRLHFKDKGETMEEKILRLIQTETSQTGCPLREALKCS